MILLSGLAHACRCQPTRGPTTRCRFCRFYEFRNSNTLRAAGRPVPTAGPARGRFRFARARTSPPPPHTPMRRAGGSSLAEQDRPLQNRPDFTLCFFTAWTSPSPLGLGAPFRLVERLAERERERKRERGATVTRFTLLTPQAGRRRPAAWTRRGKDATANEWPQPHADHGPVTSRSR